MLNKIEKGMSNAAEKINDNFEKGLVEIGENEKGHYKVYGDGTLECRTKLTLEHTGSTMLRKTWILPKEFIDDDLDFMITTITPPEGKFTYVLDVPNIYPDKVNIRALKELGVGKNFAAGDEAIVTVVAYGKVK